ncbi:MAG TPA: asparagine synthase (glutamine-hydrolyzing), partial [Tepidisphaeraceae bacterium]|nr:asparagine synthase (glutamine-hydrolyzing) [Tepidisphaeraceae bacterium]
MCGFAGVIAWDEKYRLTKGTLTKMSAAIAHRGPDGEGYHLTRENEPITPDTPQVGLAFRRLAILDPDPRSNQPFTDGHRWLVFNGEIYNFRELRKELTALRPQYQWRTTGDTEVLLCAYAHWREKCVDHLNGMFAFAVWDQINETLFLARDRMGQKTLFYAHDGRGGVAFASEISALRAIGWIDWMLEKLAITQYLICGYITAPNTVFNNVIELPPASRISFSHAREIADWENLTFFSPNENRGHKALDPVEDTRRLIRNSVERQLVSDVPLGVFLSGGVDSSIIALCSSEQRLNTFSISFDDPRYDESRYA